MPPAFQQCTGGTGYAKNGRCTEDTSRSTSLADAQTQKIIAIAVTYERTCDSPILKELLGAVVVHDDQLEAMLSSKSDAKTDSGNDDTDDEKQVAVIYDKSNVVKGPLQELKDVVPVNKLGIWDLSVGIIIITVRLYAKHQGRITVYGRSLCVQKKHVAVHESGH